MRGSRVLGVLVGWLLLSWGVPAARGQAIWTVVVLGPSGHARARIVADGAVTAAAADGHGGWYVGGDFTRIDGVPRLHLAHLRPNGSVDPRWRAGVNRNGSGFAFEVSGIVLLGWRVYVAGTFLRADGRHVFGLAAFDSTTGALDGRWRPPVAGSALIGLVAAGRRLVLAGSFAVATAAGATRFDLVAVNDSTGALVASWAPGIEPAPSPSVYGEVEALAAAGDELYAIGNFHAGSDGSGFAAIDRDSGRLQRSFRPPRLRSGQFLTLAATRSRVFVGGTFHELGGHARPGLAALDPRTGAVDPAWRPRICGGLCDDFSMLATARGLVVGGTALDPRTGATVRGWAFHGGDARPLAASGSRVLVANESLPVP